MKKRLFISVDIPLKIVKKISQIQKQIPEFVGNKTKPENFHLTLKFLGDVGEEKISLIDGFLKEIKFERFISDIDEIGVFSENFLRIIWLNIKNCHNLQKEVDTKLSNIFAKEKRFMGHLTIARIKSVKDSVVFLDKLKKIKIPKIIFEIGVFKLKESILTKDGPIYKTIGEYNLI